MVASGTTFGIPLPARRTDAQTHAEAGPTGRLVADFLRATDALSCGATAELAGVRPETIRKWRRRVPHWLKRMTSRRLTAYLAGTPLPAPDEGLQRMFRRVLRSASGPEEPASGGGHLNRSVGPARHGPVQHRDVRADCLGRNSERASGLSTPPARPEL